MTADLASIDRPAAMAAVRRLIEEQNRLEIPASNTPLEIDSFTIILIITYAEESLGVRLDLDRLDFDDFESLDRIEETLFSPENHLDAEPPDT